MQLLTMDYDQTCRSTPSNKSQVVKESLRVGIEVLPGSTLDFNVSRNGLEAIQKIIYAEAETALQEISKLYNS